MTDIVQEISKYLLQSQNPGMLDIRITYTRTGVKANIYYVASSVKQKKPFPTLKEALENALESYIENINHRIEYAHDDMKSERKPVKDDGMRRLDEATHLKHYADKALAYLNWMI